MTIQFPTKALQALAIGSILSVGGIGQAAAFGVDGGPQVTRSCKYDIFVRHESTGSIPLRLNPVQATGKLGGFDNGDNRPGLARFRAAKIAESCLLSAAGRGPQNDDCTERSPNDFISGSMMVRFKYRDLRRHAREVLCDALLAEGVNVVRDVTIFSRVQNGATRDIARECSIPARKRNIGTSFWAGKARNAPQYKTLTTIAKVVCKR